MRYDKLYEKYSFMMNGVIEEDRMDITEFSEFLRKKLEGMNYVEVENKGEEGFLYYDSWKENYATNEKMAVKRFQKFE